MSEEADKIGVQGFVTFEHFAELSAAARIKSGV